MAGFTCDCDVVMIYSFLSYDVAVIQGITPYHKNSHDHRCNSILSRTRDVTDNVRVNNAFPLEILFILKTMKYHLKGSYDKPNISLVVISYEIYETRRRSFRKFHMEWPLV